MNNAILSSGLAFLIVYFSIPAIIEVAYAKKLYDEPDQRKVHKCVIPTLGGLGIFAGFVIATLIGVPVGASGVLQYIIAASLVVFFLGIKDDILILSASKKFVGQILAAIIIIKFGGIKIDNFYGVLGIHEIPNTASWLFSIFTIVVITNSFNLIDGIDGLAGSLGIFCSLVFGIYFYFAGFPLYTVMAFSMAGALLGFLMYNYSPAKIFMGDTGSLLVGLINAVFVIKFINVAAAPNAAVPIASTPLIGFSILMIPLFDTLRVFAIRIFKRRSPFSPDRNHFHHFLLECGLNHNKIVITSLISSLLFVVVAWMIKDLNINLGLAILSCLALIGVGIAYYSKSEIQKIAGKKVVAVQEPTADFNKVIPLAGKPERKADPLEKIVEK